MIDQKGVLALADIPGKETLICKIMLGMRSSLQGLAYALQAIIDKGEVAPVEAAAEEAPAAPAEEAAPAAEEAAAPAEEAPAAE